MFPSDKVLFPSAAVLLESGRSMATSDSEAGTQAELFDLVGQTLEAIEDVLLDMQGFFGSPSGARPTPSFVNFTKRLQTLVGDVPADADIGNNEGILYIASATGAVSVKRKNSSGVVSSSTVGLDYRYDTIATQPAANTVPAGTVSYVSDLQGGQVQRSNGTIWQSIGLAVGSVGRGQLARVALGASYSNQSQSSTTDVTGMTATVTTTGRPLEIRVNGNADVLGGSGAPAIITLVEDATIRDEIKVSNQAYVSGQRFIYSKVMTSTPGLAAGSHTYKLQLSPWVNPAYTQLLNKNLGFADRGDFEMIIDEV